jgi:electron transfer flavoprotein beta subunit
MNFVVCIKRVPSTESRVQIAPDGKSLNPQGVETVLNPYDEYALEAALQLKEKLGGETTVVSLDPDGNDTILRNKVLPLGIDKAVMIKGGSAFDGAANAEILASVLKTIPHDVILFGKQAIDSDSYQVPALIAHHLGLPRVNVVTKLEVADKRVLARRQIEGGEEVVELATPCVVSCQKGLNSPRLPKMQNIMAAKKKTVEVRTAPTVAAKIEILKMELPPERPAGRIVGQGKDAVKELVRLLREEAKVL